MVDVMAPMGALGPPDVQVAIRLFTLATQIGAGSHRIVFESYTEIS